VGTNLEVICFFGKRIGFSGTPSNLLPVDLGTCLYEPRSDGRIIHVLTSPQVTTACFKEDWNARSLLRDIATANPPIHALIDTGALITGMDNEKVAKYLLKYLPEWMEGVVYLDRMDRQMILLRQSGRSVNLAQCGISPAKRFTFYDQVHTTGMDIKQAPSARAVITIGKDMTFRDYAQGAYRMRGIGKGQTIQLYIIPEVQNRIETELGPVVDAQGTSLFTKRPELDVPAWLLLNSMRMESIQFIQMSNQELHNVWRKKALYSLLIEVEVNSFQGKHSPPERLRRFVNPAVPENDLKWLRKCIEQFREPISYAIDDCVPVPQSYSAKLQVLVDKNQDFVTDDKANKRIVDVMQRVAQLSTKQTEIQSSNLSFNAEVVHENEQEAQQEAEEEAEEEEQKISAFTRDDEQPNPWKAELLKSVPSGKLGEEPFYHYHSFKVNDDAITLQFPELLLLSDNFFRPRWCGLGDRRLKNIGLVLEWIPDAWTESAQDKIRRYFAGIFKQLTVGCDAKPCSNPKCANHPESKPVPQNQAAAESLKLAVAEVQQSEPFSVLCDSTRRALELLVQQNYDKRRYLAALSLAEGETIRKLIHSRPDCDILTHAPLALRSLSGSVIDQSLNFLPEQSGQETIPIGMQCLRFINCEMYYTDTELELLEKGLSKAPLDSRLSFFSVLLRLRRRERNLWGDTPLAKIFTPQEEWHMLRTRALLEQVTDAILKSIKTRHLDPLGALARFDADTDGFLSYEELQRAFEWMQLGFSPRDYYTLVRYADSDNTGKISADTFKSVFQIPADYLTHQQKRGKSDSMSIELVGNWMCQNCTYLNSVHSHSCVVCEYGWTGRRECPADKWECTNCTFYNPKSQFYCEMCNKARPDLASVRF